MSETKVLHVIARMNVGGTARYVGELMKDIPGMKLATGYVQGNELEDKIMNEVDFIRVEHLGRKISLLNDLKSWIELRQIVREVKPEIIHTHTFKAGLVGRLIPGKHKRIHTFHGHLFADSSFSAFSKKLIVLVEKFLATRTDLLISVGEKIGEEIRLRGIGGNKNWVSIPPGIKPLPKLDKQDARKKLRLPESGIIIGWMGRMAPVKNPFLLLEIAEELPKVQFAMAGGGDLLNEVISKAPSNVKVLGWAEASEFWSAVDIAVSTSENEGMPVAIIEAQMHGVPIVSTDVGSNSEVIVSGLTGVLVTANLTSMCSELRSLIRQENEYKKMSINAVLVATKKFSLDNFIFMHLERYDSILTKN